MLSERTALIWLESYSEQNSIYVSGSSLKIHFVLNAMNGGSIIQESIFKVAYEISRTEKNLEFEKLSID